MPDITDAEAIKFCNEWVRQAAETFARQFLASLVGLVLAFMLPQAALAVGPVLNHCVATWTASPSADVVSYRVYFSPTAGGAGALVGTVAAPTVTWSCPPAAITDGQKYATVTAVDGAGNESARSNEFPFVFDGTAPAVPTNLQVQ